MKADFTSTGNPAPDTRTGEGAPWLNSEIAGTESPAYVGIRAKDLQLLLIVDANLADATRRAGEHLVCRPGCTQCCHGAFAISALDALRLRNAMAKLAVDAPHQAAIIANRAQAYLAEFGPGFPGDPQTGILGQSEQEQAAFEDFANEAPCPALNPANGLCDLYAARPMTCRTFGPPVWTGSGKTRADEPENETREEDGGFAVCELCFTSATPEEIAAAEMTVPYEDERKLADALNPATGNAASGDTIIAYCLTQPQPQLPAPEEPS